MYFKLLLFQLKNMCLDIKRLNFVNFQINGKNFELCILFFCLFFEPKTHHYNNTDGNSLENLTFTCSTKIKQNFIPLLSMTSELNLSCL